jgi:hypothetical protein
VELLGLIGTAAPGEVMNPLILLQDGAVELAATLVTTVEAIGIYLKSVEAAGRELV